MDPAGFDPDSPAGRRFAMEREQQERLRRDEQMRPRGNANAADSDRLQNNSNFVGDGGFSRNPENPAEDHFSFAEQQRRRSR